MKKYLPYLLSLVLILVIGIQNSVAQCAMCRATIEANAANSDKYGVGLNTGILYLMCVPYIAATVLGYLWYKSAKAKGSLPKFR
jgi:hypothetical protein